MIKVLTARPAAAAADTPVPLSDKDYQPLSPALADLAGPPEGDDDGECHIVEDPGPDVLPESWETSRAERTRRFLTPMTCVFLVVMVLAVVILAGTGITWFNATSSFSAELRGAASKSILIAPGVKRQCMLIAKPSNRECSSPSRPELCAHEWLWQGPTLQCIWEPRYLPEWTCPEMSATLRRFSDVICPHATPCSQVSTECRIRVRVDAMVGFLETTSLSLSAAILAAGALYLIHSTRPGIKLE